jgi:hypothetical protein
MSDENQQYQESTRDDSSDFEALAAEMGFDPEVAGDEDGDDGIEHGADEADADDDSDAESEAKVRRPNKGPLVKDEESDDTSAEDDGDEKRRKGQERLAQNLAKKERELTALNRKVRELEAKLAEQTGTDPDLLEDRVAYVRGQIARGLGLKSDDPKVAAELKELLDDLVFSDVSDDTLSSNEELRRQVEERKARNASRRDRIAIERRMAELERREKEAEAAQTKARVTGQLTQYLTAKAEEFPYLNENPDAHPSELVWMGLQQKLAEGEDLSTDDAMAAAVDHITSALEAHYSKVAERFVAVASKRSAAIGIDEADGSKKRAGGDRPKKRPGGKSTTATSGKGGGGRGSAPSRQDADEEAFEDFAEKFLTEQSVAKRRR